jgi:hypothetical protein
MPLSLKEGPPFSEAPASLNKEARGGPLFSTFNFIIIYFKNKKTSQTKEVYNFPLLLNYNFCFARLGSYLFFTLFFFLIREGIKNQIARLRHYAVSLGNPADLKFKPRGFPSSDYSEFGLNRFLFFLFSPIKKICQVF